MERDSKLTMIDLKRLTSLWGREASMVRECVAERDEWKKLKRGRKDKFTDLFPWQTICSNFKKLNIFLKVWTYETICVFLFKLIHNFFNLNNILNLLLLI